MHIGILPICVSEYAKEIHTALDSPETRVSLRPLRGDPRECRLAVGFGLLEAGFSLAIPSVLAAIADVGIPEMDAGYILLCGLIAVAFEILRLVCAVIARRFAARASTRLAAELRRAVFAHTRQFRGMRIDAADFSVLTTCFDGDVSRLQTGVNDVLPNLLRTPVVTLAALISAFTVGGRCGCVFAASILAFVCVGASITLLRIPLARRVRERRDDLARAMCEGGDIRLLSGKLSRSQRRSNRVCALLRPLNLFVFGISAAMLLRIGLQTGLSRGRIAALLVYLFMTADAFTQSADRFFAASEAGLCGKRIGALLVAKTKYDLPRTPASDGAASGFRMPRPSSDFEEEASA